MTFNFTDEEERQQFALDAVAEEVSEQKQDIDEMMSEAERRFSKAKYYEILIKQPIFGDNSNMALEVVKEIQEFSRERLSILLGLKAERTSQEFSPEELNALKALAGRLLQRPEIGIPSAPTIKQAEAPRAPSLLSAPSPVQKPAPKMASKQATKPEVAKGKPGPKPKAVEAGETLEVPQADGSSIKYAKMTTSDGTEFWQGPNGNKYTLETNDSGQNFMRSIQRQSRPQGNVRQIPPLNVNSMAQVASQQTSELERTQDKTIAFITSTVTK